MIKIFPKDQIEEVINTSEIIDAIENGFKLLDENKVVLGPVAHLSLPDSAIFHGKYGYVKGDSIFVMKAGCYVPKNKLRGDSSIKSSMQIFDIATGELKALLLDQGLLTNLRTAAAGAVSAKYLSRENVDSIGIIGTGTQARLQLRYILEVLKTKKVIIWGRNPSHANEFKTEISKDLSDITLEVAGEAKTVCENSELIITTTSATDPIVKSEWIKSGTTIIAVGADASGKQELDSRLVSDAELLITDLKSQCLDHGEISHAYNSGFITESTPRNLGNIINDSNFMRNESDIAIIDLTGVAIQDIQITKLIYKKLTDN
jgi:ornithine cyclodeaminase